MIDAALKATLQKKYGDEQVYVVPFNQVAGVPDKFADPLTFCSYKFYEGSFILRSDAEYNPAMIQLIPYIIVTNKAHDKLYVTKRIAGEERLRDSMALGCGGHINPCDSGRDIIMNAAFREMNEELNIHLTKDTELQQVGTVRDLSSETNEHLGIVILATARTVSVKEKENLKGAWMTYEDLVINYSCFESWAKHILDYMFEHGSKISSLLGR